MKRCASIQILLALLISFVAFAIPAFAQTPVVSVTNVVTTISEPSSFADFVIAKDSGADITVNFEMLGSAVLGTDYVVLGGETSVAMPGSANIATVRIQVLDDFLVEPDKTIILHLLPGAGYTVGNPASATITLRSNDPLYLPPPRFDLLPTLSPPFRPPMFNPPIVAPRSQMSFDINTSGSFGPGTSALVFLDGTAIGTSTYSSSVYANFQVFFTSPSRAGLHLLTTILSPTNGVSQILTQSFRVADALVQPPSQGQGSISNNIVMLNTLFTQPDNNPDTSGAYMEILVPSAATNWKSALFMTSSSGGAHLLATYRGNGVITTNDAAADAELVAAFTPSAGNPLLQFDVTRWTQTNAGGYIGFKLQVDPTNGPPSGTTWFGNVYLGFFSETNDVPTHFRWLNYPTNILFVDTPFDLEIYDSDSRIKSVSVFEQVRLAPSTNYVHTNIATVAVDLPPGTNFVSLQLTNLNTGSRQFGIEVATESGATSYLFPYLNFYPAQAGAPVHRWFGTDGDSRSFYVVDAAGRAWVWGDNSDGQLGLAFQGTPITRPVMLTPPAGKKWRQFTSNSYCAVGVTDDGAIYGMGQNIGGTSIFATANPNVPAPLSMGANSFARRAGLTQNSLWIINEWSRLVELLPANVSTQDPLIDLQTGGSHLLALEASGDLLYLPGNDTSSRFGVVAGSTLPWKDISTCATHSLALDAKGRLFGWGQNNAGQLPSPIGTSPSSPQFAAFPTGATAWTNVAAGKYVSLAITQDGRLYAWGVPGYTGSAEPWVKGKIVPVAVPSDETGWLDIATGSTFAMALSTRGNLYVWGTIPSSPAPRHIDFPELVTGLPDLLEATSAAGPIVTFEPTSIRASSQFQADLIAPAGSNLEIQTSADLVNWTTITNIANAGAKTTFTAPIPDAGNLFIRVR